MAKFYTPDGRAIEDGRLAEDYGSAPRSGPLRIGALALYYRDGLRRRAVPLEEIRSAELVSGSCRTKCCCGKIDLETMNLILSGEHGELASVYSEDRRQMDSALAALRERLPGVEITL